MAILNRIVQISPEPCESYWNVFGPTELMLELSECVGSSRTGDSMGDHTEGECIIGWMIWPDASSKDECIAKQAAVFDKYPDTVAQIKQYIADNNITIEDQWFESFEPTEADQAVYKKLTD